MSVRSSSCSDQEGPERRDEGVDNGVQATEAIVLNGVPSSETNGFAITNGEPSPNGLIRPSTLSFPGGSPHPNGASSPSSIPSPNGVLSPSGILSPNGVLSPSGIPSPNGTPGPSVTIPKPPHRFKKKSAPRPPPTYPSALSVPIEEYPKVTDEDPPPPPLPSKPPPSVEESPNVEDEAQGCPTPPSVQAAPPSLKPSRPVSLPPPVVEVKPRAPRPASAILETLGFRSAGSVSAKSAPATPHSEWTPPVSPTPPRSPSNSAASRHDKSDAHPRGGKPAALSTSAPASGSGSAGGGSARGESPASGGGGASPVPPPGTPTPVDEPGSSKSRQKKFHRHFKQVAQEERVLNYYSCALVADILLQGQLYITKNYFAFYSNVFGYVTKLLIPTASVVRISKEKTARIIPNAVGVVTPDEKHVFGSLLSRDATYRLMTQVWKSAMLPEPAPAELRGGGGGEEDDSVAMSTVDGYESSLSGSERSCGPLLGPPTSEAALHAVLTKVDGGVRTITTPSGLPSADGSSRLRPPGALLAAGTALLVCLFLSAGFLLYRISLMQTRFNDNPLLSGSDHVYQEILKWQAQLHSRSASEVQDFLSSNLDQLAKVRQSLEALSQLLLHNEAAARDQRPNS